MFPGRYFADRYFAARYWPKGSSVVDEATDWSTLPQRHRVATLPPREFAVTLPQRHQVATLPKRP
jgi:hypothetical protein